jgi:hypothetical protein
MTPSQTQLEIKMDKWRVLYKSPKGMLIWVNYTGVTGQQARELAEATYGKENIKAVSSC